MKYDEMFQNIMPGKTPADYLTKEEFKSISNPTYRYNVGHMFKMSAKTTCVICSELTDWQDLAGHIVCSEECNWKFLDSLDGALSS